MEVFSDYVMAHPWGMLTALVGVTCFCTGVVVATAVYTIGRRRR